MERIILDKFEVMGNVEPAENDGEYRLSFEVQGANNYHLFSNLFANNTFNIIVPSLGQEFLAKRLSSSCSYTELLDQYTEVSFSLTYKEYTEDEDTCWNPIRGTLHTAIGNWVRTRAISELLIEKGIFTKDEYIQKLDLVADRDFWEMKNFINEGKRQDANNKAEKK